MHLASQSLVLSRDVIDHISAFVGVLDPDGTVMEVNETALKVSGACRGDVLGRKMWDIPFFTYDSAVAGRIQEAVEEGARGTSARFDVSARTATGEIVIVDVMIRPVRDQNGRIKLLVLSGIDITERKRVEDELRRSLDLLERAQRVGRLGHWSYNIPAAQLSWSAEARRMFLGDENAELTTERMLQLVHPDDLERLRAESREAIETGKRFVSSYRIRRENGEERIFEMEAEPDYGPDGQPLRMFGITRDVTEARLHEREILEQQRIIDQSLEPIFSWQIEDGVTHWNRGCEQLYGYSKNEAFGQAPYKLLASQFPSPTSEILELLQAGESWTGEVVQTTRDGRQVTVEARIDPAQVDDRMLVLEAHRDITGRKAAEKQLKLSEERLAIAAHLAGVGFFDFDQISGKVDLSPEPWSGVLPETATIEDAVMAVHPADRDAFRNAIAKAHDPTGTGEFEQVFRLLKDTGEIRWIRVKSQTFFEGEGKDRRAVRTVGAAIDITERHNWEEQQRLLMGELNHRVRNTLSVVQAIATQTLRSAKDPETFVQDFKGRIQAIASAYKLLNETTWQGAHLTDLIREQLASACGAGQIAFDGPEVWLPPQVALNLGMVLHELGTNAQKHGALSVPSGCVQLTWAVRKEDKKSVLEMSWRELGGPPVRPPEARGFGMALIERTIGGTVEGEAKIRFDPEGLHCLIELPLR